MESSAGTNLDEETAKATLRTFSYSPAGISEGDMSKTNRTPVNSFSLSSEGILPKQNSFNIDTVTNSNLNLSKWKSDKEPSIDSSWISDETMRKSKGRRSSLDHCDPALRLPYYR
jgi:hypothetical protein